MNSSTLAIIHIVVVNLFLLIYFVKTILLFTNTAVLQKFTKATRVIEMIVSTLFLITGIWMFVILGAIKVLQIVKLACVLIAIPVSIIGFKKQKKFLALLSFLLIVAAYGISEAAKNKTYIPVNVVVSGGEGATQPGIKTFAANCSMCHGMDGKKQYRGAADLSLSDAGNTRIDTLIRNGSKGKMPAFHSVLSDNEITAVSDFVLTLRKK